VLSTVLLLVTYGLVTVSAQAFAGVGTTGTAWPTRTTPATCSPASAARSSAPRGFGWFLSKLLVLMVLSSASASTQTTIMPTARTALSMAEPQGHPVRLRPRPPALPTPTWSTIGMGLASIAFYALLTKISGNVLSDSIDSLGLAIAFYYGLTGFACAWHFGRFAFRPRRGRRPRVLWLRFVLPLLGALILFAFFIYGAYQFWNPAYGYTQWDMPFPPHWHIGGVFLTGVGSLVLGIPLMYIYRALRPAYFRGEVVRKGEWPDLSEEAGETAAAAVSNGAPIQPGRTGGETAVRTPSSGYIPS
jgi:amino acid transporter